MVTVDISLHQTAALLLCLALVVICTLLTREQGEGGSIGINFAIEGIVVIRTSTALTV
jgi:hypothetical protein